MSLFQETGENTSRIYGNSTGYNTIENSIPASTWTRNIDLTQSPSFIRVEKQNFLVEKIKERLPIITVKATSDSMVDQYNFSEQKEQVDLKDNSFKSKNLSHYNVFFENLFLNLPCDNVARALETQQMRLQSSDIVAVSIALPESVDTAFNDWKAGNGAFLETQILSQKLTSEVASWNLKQLLRYHFNECLIRNCHVQLKCEPYQADVTLSVTVADLLTSSLKRDQSSKRKSMKQQVSVCPKATPDDSQMILHIVLKRAPFVFTGRYTKLKRNISQTRWNLHSSEDTSEGCSLFKGSVEECIGSFLLSYFAAKSYQFHAAGREDQDVRMLGNGRPFLILLSDPQEASPKDVIQRQKLAESLENSINVSAAPHGVSIQNFHFVHSTVVKNTTLYRQIHSLAEEKQKIYGCVCYTPHILLDKTDLFRMLESLRGNGISIQQKTPTRVCHRRSQMIREKMVQCQDIVYINSHIFLLRLKTQAGTYVKEFVHGDFGRTVPSLSTLLKTTVHLLALDVLALIL